MIAALPWDVLRERWLPWKAGLYDLEVISPWGCYFWTSGLAYDISSNPDTDRKRRRKGGSRRSSNSNKHTSGMSTGI